MDENVQEEPTVEPLKRKHIVREYAESIFIAIILALIIRTFIVQAFKIPSGSMEDTLLIGDHLLVNKFIYGTQIPLTDKRILPLRSPRLGDIIVFEFPEDTKNTSLSFWQKKDFIKRVIGVPGDVVQVIKKRVYVNGKPYDNPAEIHKDNNLMLPCPPGEPKDSLCNRDFFGPVKVPADSFFVMGDNRDRSHDSRFWGFVPYRNIKGMAFIKYWSWDSQENKIRWNRIGKSIK